MGNSASWRLGVGLALCVLIVGCGAGAGEGDGAGEAGSAATSSSGSGTGDSSTSQTDVIRDDFSDPESGWQRRTRDNYGADYEDGAYVVWVDNGASNYIASAASYEAAAELTDTRFEITATKVSGPEDAPIGLSCRQWSDGDRRGIYFADLEAEGQVRIGLYDEDGQQILAEAQRPGLWRDGANTLRLDCIGDQITFSINAEEVLRASNDRFPQGRVGVRAGGGSSGVTRVAFDDAVITVMGS